MVEVKPTGKLNLLPLFTVKTFSEKWPIYIARLGR